MVKGKRVYEKSVPVYLQSVSNLCNQLLRSGTSIGANNAEACNAITKSDFKSKSYIALKEARESLYWIDLLHRNGYLTDKQHDSLYIPSAIIHLNDIHQTSGKSSLFGHFYTKVDNKEKDKISPILDITRTLKRNDRSTPLDRYNKNLNQIRILQFLITKKEKRDNSPILDSLTTNMKIA